MDGRSVSVRQVRNRGLVSVDENSPSVNREPDDGEMQTGGGLSINHDATYNMSEALTTSRKSYMHSAFFSLTG
jgi:hypothetical protein